MPPVQNRARAVDRQHVISPGILIYLYSYIYIVYIDYSSYCMQKMATAIKFGHAFSISWTQYVLCANFPDTRGRELPCLFFNAPTRCQGRGAPQCGRVDGSVTTRTVDTCYITVVRNPQFFHAIQPQVGAERSISSTGHWRRFEMIWWICGQHLLI